MAHAQSKPNWFAIWISIAAVVVIVVASVLVVWMNNTVSSGGTAPAANAVNQETGAISFGDGDTELDVYLDFMCPFCNTFEQTYGDAIDEAVEAGTITYNVHPVTILDRLSQGTEFSTRAANAMYCVADAKPESALQFMRVMFDNQPAENSTGLPDEQLISIAAGVGAGDITECVTDQTFSTFVAAKGKLPDGATGTPTVVVNGEIITLTGDPNVDILDRIG